MELYSVRTKRNTLDKFNRVFKKQCNSHDITINNIKYDDTRVMICDIDRLNQYNFIIELVEIGLGKFGYSIEVSDGSRMIKFNELRINKNVSRTEQFIDAYNILTKLSMTSTKNNMNYFDKKLNQKMELSYNETDGLIYNNLGSVVDKKEIYDYLIENDYGARVDYASDEYGTDCYTQLAFILDDKFYNTELYLRAIDKLAKN